MHRNGYLAIFAVSSFVMTLASLFVYFKISKQTDCRKQVKSQEKVQVESVEYLSLLLRHDCQLSYLHDEQPLLITLNQVKTYPQQTSASTLQMQ